MSSMNKKIKLLKLFVSERGWKSTREFWEYVVHAEKKLLIFNRL